MSESILSRIRRWGSNFKASVAEAVAAAGAPAPAAEPVDALLLPDAPEAPATVEAPAAAAAPATPSAAPSTAGTQVFVPAMMQQTPSGRVRQALPAAPLFNPGTAVAETAEKNAERHKFLSDLLQMVLIRLNGQAERTVELVGKFEQLPEVFGAQQARLDTLPEILAAVREIPSGARQQVEMLGSVVGELRSQTAQHEKTAASLSELNREIAAYGDGVRELSESNTRQLQKMQAQQAQALTVVMKNQKTQWQALQQAQTRVIEELNARHAEAIQNIHAEHQAAATRMTRMAVAGAAVVMALLGGALAIARVVVGGGMT